MKIQGKITQMIPKRITAKTGKSYTVFTAMVDGQNINLGFNRFKFKEGQQIEVNVEPSKFGGFDIVEGGTPSSAPAISNKPAPFPNVGGGGKVFPVPASHGDHSIIRQSALKAAVDTVSLFSKEHKTVESFTEAAIKTAYKYAEFSSGRREEKLAKEIVASGNAKEVEEELMKNLEEGNE